MIHQCSASTLISRKGDQAVAATAQDLEGQQPCLPAVDWRASDAGKTMMANAATGLWHDATPSRQDRSLGVRLVGWGLCGRSFPAPWQRFFFLALVRAAISDLGRISNHKLDQGPH
jgi:hypothetical protein